MKNLPTRESAVSPVVGIMLMLVVTIIIAAVVSAFAGGLGSGTQKPPVASVSVATNNGGSYTEFVFTHNGGDPINTKDVKIVTWLTLPNGTVVKHEQTPTSPPSWESGATVSAARYTRIPWNYDLIAGADTHKGYYTAAEINAADFVPPKTWFGTVVFTDGMYLRTYNNNATASFLGLVNSTKVFPADAAAYDAGTAVWKDCLKKTCQVEIKWLHVPSGKYIVEQEIVVGV